MSRSYHRSHDMCVAAFYQFASLPDYKAMRQRLLEIMLSKEIKGTILLAEEGVNGTISGSSGGVKEVFNWLQSHPALGAIKARYSPCDKEPFHRTKVKLKQEIVTMGKPDMDFCPGLYVSPDKWNELIIRKDVLLVDTRNDYEYAIGTFHGAINPQLESFRDFPDYFQVETLPSMQENGISTLAMFCTGGIRCEKASSLAKASGIPNVYHLKGGILAYLEQVSDAKSLWQGECFVFDNRVAVGHGLVQGNYDQCYACRHPVSCQDKQSKWYSEGKSCPHCHDKRSHFQQQNGGERMKQIRLAQAKGKAHLGLDLRQAKTDKQLRKESLISA